MRYLLLFLCLQTVAANATPRVVVSITPLQEITASIMVGVGQPDVIIENHASTHHFAFKPSHMKLLQQADLVIWIDRHFESGFHALPEILRATTRPIELTPLLGLDHGDGHIWFSPRRVMESIQIIADALMQQDPQNQDAYRRNATILNSAVADWRRNALDRWQNGIPNFITDHDFLGHFAKDFGIEHIVSIHDRHGDQGGLRDLYHLEHLLQEKPADCLLTQAIPSRLANSLAQKHQIPIITIAADIDTNSNHPGILQRFDQLTAALASCATGKQE